jgi:uncharacterized protein (TIGR03382 family)
VLAGSLHAVLTAGASAHGRTPATVSIHVRQGNESDIVAGLTFGLVISHDSGATWHWMCEKAVGYAVTYDPIYAYSHSGGIFATTYNGFKVNRDGCVYAATSFGTTFIAQAVFGPDHALYAAAADPADAKIYKSTDDGMTFPTSASPGQLGDWWDSIAVAPSDAMRIYLTGYLYVKQCSHSLNAGAVCQADTDCPGLDVVHEAGSDQRRAIVSLGATGNCEPHKYFLLFKSVDGGANFTPMTTTGLTTSLNSAIDVVGISPTDPDLIYARVSLENGIDRDGLYMSANAGASWTKILANNESIYFLARMNGDIVAATQSGGSQKSIDAGMNWTSLASPPHINCLVESSAGEVWACTEEFGVPGVPHDGFGIMKSSDLVTWTGMLDFKTILGPVDCPAGTDQRDMCYPDGPDSPWCTERAQLGIASTAINCDGPPEAAVAGDGVSQPKGCCDAGGSGPAALGLSSFIGVWLLRRRCT